MRCTKLRPCPSSPPSWPQSRCFRISNARGPDQVPAGHARQAFADPRRGVPLWGKSPETARVPPSPNLPRPGTVAMRDRLARVTTAAPPAYPAGTGPPFFPAGSERAHRRSRVTGKPEDIRESWCPRSDSNRHALRRRILNPLRLPFRHSGQRVRVYRLPALPSTPPRPAKAAPRGRCRRRPPRPSAALSGTTASAVRSSRG